MALNKQNAHLDLKGGMDQSTDNRLVIPSKLLDVRDAVFDDATPRTTGAGTVVRRGGLSTQALTSSISIAAPVRLFTNEGHACIEDSYGAAQVTKDTGATRVEPRTGGVSARGFVRAGLETRPISDSVPAFADGSSGYADAPKRANEWDCAYNSNADRSCWVWVKNTRTLSGYGRLSLGYSIVDEATGTIIYQGEVFGSYTYTAPRVVYCSSTNKFLLYYAKYENAGTIMTIEVITISGSGTVSVSAASSVYSVDFGGANYVGSAGFETMFDCIVDGSSVFFVVRSSSTTVALKLLSGTNGYTASGTGTITASAGTIGSLAAVVTTGTYKYVAVWARKSYYNNIRAQGWDSGSFYTSQYELIAGGTGGSSEPLRLAAYYYEGTIVGFDEQLVVSLDSILNTGSYCRAYIACDANLATTNIAKYTYPTGFGMALSGRFVASSVDNKLYLPTMSVTEDVSTCYLEKVSELLDGTSDRVCVVARVDYGECKSPLEDYLHESARVPASFVRGNTVAFGYWKYVTDLQLVGTKAVQPSILHCAIVDFSAKLGQAEVNGLTYLAGACPAIFDGKQIVEEGFHFTPQIETLTAVATGNGNIYRGLAAGTYYFSLTVGWQDARGNWHESSPAEPVSVTTTAGLPDVSASYVLPPSWKPDVRTIWYRTVDGASTGPFYRVGPLYDVATASDASIVANEQLYTTPGVAGQALYHDPMPACRHIEQHQDRLFLSGCEDGYTVFYSNQTYEGRGVEFSTLLQKRTDYEFGRVVGTQSQDGKLCVFGERQIGVLLGQGPTDNGEQDGYSDIEVIIHNTGAKWRAPKSIVTTNDGIWFQSNTNGLRLLSRNGSLAQRQNGGFVGSEVDAQLGTSYVVNAALVGESTSQVRFYHSGGGVLVYDTKWGQWSRFSNHTHVDACYADGRFYHVTSTPKLLYYNESAHTDDGTAITMYLLFPWLSFAGIQGFQRVYSALFLGGPIDASSDTQVVTLYVAYNYDGNNFTTAINAQDVTVSLAGMTQFEHKLATQKCESLQMWLEVKSKTNASRFRLSDVLLQVGLKPGKFKLPSTRRF